VLILGISILGCIGLRIVQHQYNYSNKKVETLYEIFDMNYLDEQFKTQRVSLEAGVWLFNIGYITIISFGVVTVGAIFFHG
jgi:hypothetical protein